MSWRRRTNRGSLLSGWSIPSRIAIDTNIPPREVDIIQSSSHRLNRISESTEEEEEEELVGDDVQFESDEEIHELLD